MDEVIKYEKELEEKREAEEKIVNDKKMSTMNEEDKKEFLKHLAHHEEEEAERKKNHVLALGHEKAHDCDVDPNSDSPLASCRQKHPPQSQTFQPYVGAADVSGVTKAEDSREWKGSHLVNYEKIFEEARTKKLKEQEEEETKKEEEMFKHMSPEAIQDYKDNDMASHHHKDRGPLYIEKPHECEFDPKDTNPTASCRLKHPPKITKNSYAPYDLTRPAVADLYKFKKPNYSIPESGLFQYN